MNKPKGYKPGEPERNWRIANFDRLDPSFVMFALDAEYVFRRKPTRSTFVPDPEFPRVQDKQATEALREIENRLLGGLKLALEKRDGGFFRELAHTIESLDYATDANRTWLFYLCFELQRRKGWVQTDFFTLREIKERALARGWDVSETRLAKICDAMGIKRAPAKQGRPKKTPNKLKH